MTRDGRPYLAFGTPGGDQQDQWSLVFLLAHLHGALDLQAAIDAPMLHSDHFPSSFYPRTAFPGRLVVEGRVGPEVLAAVRSRGHDVQVAGDWSQALLAAGYPPVTANVTNTVALLPGWLLVRG